MTAAALRDQVVVEWVLANGNLRGFEGRVDRSLEAWETLEEPMTVYRAQGGSKIKAVEGTVPTKLLTGIRPVLATSKTIESARRYAGKTCCLFEITLPVGTRVIDVAELIQKNGPISDDILQEVRSLCTTDVVKWPNPRTGTKYIQDALTARCEGREIRSSHGVLVETVPPEDEIMVYAKDLALAQSSEPLETPLAPGITSYSVKGGRRRISRGRTFRRTSKRRNKNGRRLTRQSKYHVRDRNS